MARSSSNTFVPHVGTAPASRLAAEGLRQPAVRQAPLAEFGGRAQESLRQLGALGESVRNVDAAESAAAFAAIGEQADRKLTPAQLIYLASAVEFSRMDERHPKPVVAAAKDLRIEPRLLSDRLSQARKLGWLQSPGKGRRGGKLTPLGQRLAVRHRQHIQELT